MNTPLVLEERVVTRLSQVRFRSRLKTWVYRLAVNYFLDVKIQPRSSPHAPDADGMVIQPRRRCPQRSDHLASVDWLGRHFTEGHT